MVRGGIIKEKAMGIEAVDAKGWRCLIPPLFFSPPLIIKVISSWLAKHSWKEGRLEERRIRTKAMNYSKQEDCMFVLDSVTIVSCLLYYTKGSDNEDRYLLYNMPDRLFEYQRRTDSSSEKEIDVTFVLFQIKAAMSFCSISTCQPYYKSLAQWEGWSWRFSCFLCDGTQYTLTELQLDCFYLITFVFH